MTNKDKLSKAIEQDINPKSYYNEIIKQIGEPKEMKKKNNIWKLSLIPVCLIVIISGLISLNYKSTKPVLKNNLYEDKENNITLRINEIDKNTSGMPKLDADIKVVTNNGINFPLPYKNKINIPSDLNKTYQYIIYTKENKDSKDYTVINNYEIIYSNDNDRSINVKYSKEHKPLRDYYFSEEGSKITTINNVELTIYKFENNYLTEFEFNDYNFDIETSNMTEQEFSNFLFSIVK